MRRFVSYSPFRVSFGGGGTDISPFCERYGGAVLNATIDRGVTVKYTPDKYDLEISSRDFLKSFLTGTGDEGNDVLHKLSTLLQSRGIGTGRIAINSDVPPGSGLGSSSALTTAILKLIYRIQGVEKDPWEIADEAFRLERDYFGITLGKQDPFAVSVGGFKFMEFLPEGNRNTSLAGYHEFMEELQRRTLLVYTGNTRESSSVLREQVAKSENDTSEVVSHLKLMKQMAADMRKSVERNDFGTFNDAVNKSWNLKKGLGKNVTNSKIDQLIKDALSNGAEAAKLMGGGSEGFILLISGEDKVEILQKALMQHSSFVVRVSFDEVGTRAMEISDSFHGL